MREATTRQPDPNIREKELIRILKKNNIRNWGFKFPRIKMLKFGGLNSPEIQYHLTKMQGVSNPNKTRVQGIMYHTAVSL